MIEKILRKIYDYIVDQSSTAVNSEVRNITTAFTDVPNDTASLVKMEAYKDEVIKDANGEPMMMSWGQLIDPAKFYAVRKEINKRGATVLIDLADSVARPTRSTMRRVEAFTS